MKFDVYIPSDILQPYVKSFAIQETWEESSYRILPDTSLVVGFQYKGRLARIENEMETPLSISGVSGLSDTRRIFKNSTDIGTVLVIFKEAGATKFFRQPLHEIFRESISLDQFMLRSELVCLEEQLAEAKADRQRIALVENFLIRKMTNTDPDKLVLAALALIHKAKGNIRIKQLTQELCISQSPLEKRFRQAVGASPKKYASIVRLKSLIENFESASSLTELGLESGFYDQSHFIKEFRAFTGDTPEKFFSEKK